MGATWERGGRLAVRRAGRDAGGADDSRGAAAMRGSADCQRGGRLAVRRAGRDAGRVDDSRGAAAMRGSADCQRGGRLAVRRAGRDAGRVDDTRGAAAMLGAIMRIGESGARIFSLRILQRSGEGGASALVRPV